MKECEYLRDFGNVYVCAFKQIPLSKEQKEEIIIRQQVIEVKQKMR